MNTAWANPYEAIENVQEHFGYLIQALTESRAAVEEDIRELSSSPRTRCLDALNLIRENLVTLGDHLERSRRILNESAHSESPALPRTIRESPAAEATV